MQKVCPYDFAKPRFELSINFLVCTRCAELLYVNELVNPPSPKNSRKINHVLPASR